MANNSLGRLEKIELRTVWNSEPADFTPWLAETDNLRLLGETIGIDLELEAQEKEVGPFRADILCKDTATNNWVLIENQLTRTDHIHLGQLLTYAAGLEAVTIVWIANPFTDEHRAALDWLNEHTDESINLFGLEVELWKIGSSPIAPKFNIVSKPNDWSRAVRTQAALAEGKITPYQQKQFEFWSAFKKWTEENTKIRVQKPGHQHWLIVTIGRSGFHLNCIASVWNAAAQSSIPEIRVELILDSARAKDHMANLEAMKIELERSIDVPLHWHNHDANKSAKVYVQCDTDFMDKTQWQTQFKWLAKYVQVFTDVFGPIVKRL